MLNQKSLGSSFPKNIPGACRLVILEQKYGFSEKHYFYNMKEIIAPDGTSMRYYQSHLLWRLQVLCLKLSFPSTKATDFFPFICYLTLT